MASIKLLVLAVLIACACAKPAMKKRVAPRSAPQPAPVYSSETQFGLPPHGYIRGRRATSAHFTYDGEEGPAHWGTLDTAYTTCAQGTQQSPINFPKDPNGVAGDLAIHWTVLPKPVAIANNGHTFQVSVSTNTAGPNNFVTYKNTKYYFQQFHFHGPSEHHIDGHHYPLELHAVHKATNGNLLVVGIVLNAGMSAAKPLIKSLEGKVPSTVSVLNISNAVPISNIVNGIDQNKFWAYQGSLTTPPCTEGVQWIVMNAVVGVRQAFIDEVAQKIGFNARFTQDVNGRVPEPST